VTEFNPFDRDPDEPEPKGPRRVPGPNDIPIRAERENRLLTPAEEQAIRDRYGYTATEKRTQAERQGAAQRVRDKTRLGQPRPLPDDIERVWGQGRLDSSGFPAADTARYLIGQWGEDAFRRSAIHRAAVQDVAHTGAKADSRSDFRKRDLPK